MWWKNWKKCDKCENKLDVWEKVVNVGKSHIYEKILRKSERSGKEVRENIKTGDKGDVWEKGREMWKLWRKVREIQANVRYMRKSVSYARYAR